jgi:3-phenylpropionate/trans-cinnamate dioxygenase ferredoxin subunit
VPTAAATFADVGRVDDFEVGRLTKAEIPGKDIYVLRAADDVWFAVKNTCPHHGAPLCFGSTAGTWLPTPPGELEFGLENRLIRCPHHGYEYDLETGKAMFVPEVTDRVVRYDVRIEDSRVLVGLAGR